MPDSDVYLDLGIALGLGLLVGLQRERSGSLIAGIRTFAILTVLGALAAILAQKLGVWILAAGFVGVAVLTVVGNLTRVPADQSPGVTTEAAMLLMYAVGATVVAGPKVAAVMVGAACAVLLQLKPILQGLARTLSDTDVRAIMQFAAMTMIILPVVPDANYGPYDAINPRKLWMLVVLVVGISLLGYVAYRVLGSRRGTALAGLLGGLISSTATTVSFARRCRAEPSAARSATLAIMLASTVLYGRVLIEVWAVARAHFVQIAVPIALLGGLAVVLSGIAALMTRHDEAEMPQHSNPSELKSALFFAGLFAMVQLASAWAGDQFGNRGVYAVAAVSGLTDMDAITLSSGRMVTQGKLDAASATRAIVIAMIANTLFKTATIGMMGGAALLRRIWWMMAAKVAAGVAIVLWWGVPSSG